MCLSPSLIFPVVVFVFSGNGATTGLLFEGLLQQKALRDCLGLKRWRGSTQWSSRLPQHGRDASHDGFPGFCSAKSNDVCSQHLK